MAISTVGSNGLNSTLDLSTKTVTLPTNPYFFAYKTSNSLVNSGAYNLCTLDSVRQSGSSYNTSTYTWTATAGDAGIWMFRGQVSFHSGSNNMTEAFPIIYLNGSVNAGNYGWVTSSTYAVRHFTTHCQTVLSISAGDTIKLYGWITAGTPYILAGDSAGGLAQTNLYGIKIA